MNAAIKHEPTVTGTAAPQLSYGLDILAQIFGWFGRAELLITALRDGQHKPGSLHAKGYAADIRTKDIPAGIVLVIVATAKKMLPGFDVVRETSGTPGATAEHLHIEFDPESNGGVNLPMVA